MAVCDAVLTAWNGSGEFITGIALRFGDVSRGSLVSKDLGVTLPLSLSRFYIFLLQPEVQYMPVQQVNCLVFLAQGI